MTAADREAAARRLRAQTIAVWRWAGTRRALLHPPSQQRCRLRGQGCAPFFPALALAAEMSADAEVDVADTQAGQLRDRTGAARSANSILVDRALLGAPCIRAVRSGSYTWVFLVTGESK